MPACLNVTDRKSTRLNSSHLVISYAVFCLKKKKLREMSRLGSRADKGWARLDSSDAASSTKCRVAVDTIAMELRGVTLFRYLFFFNDTATTEIYTLSLHDALPI